MLRVSLQHLASLATLCVLAGCHTWALRLPTFDSSHSGPAEGRSGSDPEFAASLGRTVSLQHHHSYLTAKDVVDSTARPVWVFVNCGSELEHSLAARKEHMILPLLDSSASAQMASVDIVWMMIAVGGMLVLPELDVQRMVVARTACRQQDKGTVNWNQPE